MEQQIQLNDHNKQEYPPMHTCEHIVNPYHDESFRLWTVSIRTYREKEK